MKKIPHSSFDSITVSEDAAREIENDDGGLRDTRMNKLLHRGSTYWVSTRVFRYGCIDRSAVGLPSISRAAALLLLSSDGGSGSDF